MIDTAVQNVVLPACTLIASFPGSSGHAREPGNEASTLIDDPIIY